MSLFGAIQLETWVDFVVAVGAVLTTLGLIGRYVVAPIVRGLRAFTEWREEVKKAVKFVEQEMKPNGGSTLRDAVDRLEAQVAKHDGMLMIDEQRFAQINLKLKAIPEPSAQVEEPASSD